MKKSGKCPKCGSSTVIQEAQVVAHEGPGADHAVDVRVDQKPSAMFMKWPVRSPLDA